MKILGIETSCDETAAAIVTGDGEILANLVLSQSEHEIYGGVVPEVAARAHLEHVDTLVREAMKQAGLDFPDLDGVAVTGGPGLIGGVMVGVMTAKSIAAAHGLPFLAVNHLEGHALTARLTGDVDFPYLLLLVSGGHSQLLAVEGVGAYKRLGTTIDDAVGEAFDKTAKLLGLGYPGGPEVEKRAADCADPAAAMKRFDLPKPMFGRDGCHMSFSGLKTAVRRHAESFGAKGPTDEDIAELCCAFQDTVAEILVDRCRNAMAAFLEDHRAAYRPGFVVSGGVAANMALRGALQELADGMGMTFAAPPVKLCADNAAMIAWAGAERLGLGMEDALDFAPRPRWPLDPDAPAAVGAGVKA